MVNKKGFTLIELLVVVLIIGILAAIALPQYNKAVEKSRSTEAVLQLKSITDAANRAFLQFNTYAPNGTALTTNDLDIGVTTDTKNFSYVIDTADAHTFIVQAVRKSPSASTVGRIDYNSVDGTLHSRTCFGVSSTGTVSTDTKVDTVCKGVATSITCPTPPTGTFSFPGGQMCF